MILCLRCFMGYDRRMAGQYDSRLKQAQAAAKSKWGSGWPLLSDDQRNGAVALELVRLIGVIDFDDALGSRLNEPAMAARLLQKLIDITELCSKAL